MATLVFVAVRTQPGVTIVQDKRDGAVRVFEHFRLWQCSGRHHSSEDVLCWRRSPSGHRVSKGPTPRVVP